MLTFSLSSLQNPFVSMLAGWSEMSQSRAWRCRERDCRSQVCMSCVLFPLCVCACAGTGLCEHCHRECIQSDTWPLGGWGVGQLTGSCFPRSSFSATMQTINSGNMRSSTITSGAVVSNKSHSYERTIFWLFWSGRLGAARVLIGKPIIIDWKCMLKNEFDSS